MTDDSISLRDQPYIPTPGEVDNLGNEALRLLKSGDPLDVQCAQVYATLALAMQVNSVGRLVGPDRADAGGA